MNSCMDCGISEAKVKLYPSIFGRTLNEPLYVCLTDKIKEEPYCTYAKEPTIAQKWCSDCGVGLCSFCGYTFKGKTLCNEHYAPIENMLFRLEQSELRLDKSDKISL